MSKRLFTDDEGNKFEFRPILPVNGPLEGEVGTIKPIKAVEKKAIYWIEFRKVFKRLDDKAISFSATERQAQKVAAAVEALMEFLTNRGTDDVEVRNNYDLMDAVEAARAAFQEDI